MEQLLVGPAELRDRFGIAPVVLAGTLEDQAELAGVADHGMASAFPGQGRDPADVGAGFHADGGALVGFEERPHALRGVGDLLAEELFAVRGESDGLVILVAEVEADCGSSSHGCSPVFGCCATHHGPARSVLQSTVPAVPGGQPSHPILNIHVLVLNILYVHDPADGNVLCLQEIVLFNLN